MEVVLAKKKLHCRHGIQIFHRLSKEKELDSVVLVRQNY